MSLFLRPPAKPFGLPELASLVPFGQLALAGKRTQDAMPLVHLWLDGEAYGSQDANKDAR
jgi:hypothetical protein